jgi:hypothetical protein
LIALLDGGDIRGEGLVGGLSLGYNELNVEYSGHKELRHFTRISSDFYPQLHDHYEHVFDEWVAAGEAERAANEAEVKPKNENSVIILHPMRKSDS